MEMISSTLHTPKAGKSSSDKPGCSHTNATCWRYSLKASLYWQKNSNRVFASRNSAACSLVSITTRFSIGPSTRFMIISVALKGDLFGLIGRLELFECGIRQRQQAAQ